MLIGRKKSCSIHLQRPHRDGKRVRARLTRRLAGPELLESRCLLSGTSDTAPAPETFYGGYLTVSGIYGHLDEMAAAYPTIAEVIDYGDSYSKTVGGTVTPDGQELAGYDLLALRITNEAIAGPKPVFVLMAGIHAREIATPEIALRFADWLTQDYGRNADATWLVDQHEIWILPTTNPDGHWYVELGAQVSRDGKPWLWRKNGHAYSSGAWPPTVFDHYGVDLNRNFDFHWGTQGVEWEPRSQTYPGPSPASEPETQAVQNLLSSVFSDQREAWDAGAAWETASGVFVSLHQHGELVLWPWWDTTSPAPSGVGLEAIGRKFASYNGYTAGPGAGTLYDASGTADDWTYGTLGVPSYTFEIGQDFTPAYTIVDSALWPENFAALVYAAKIARTPYATVLGPDASRVTVERDLTGFTITATIDDTGNGGQPVAAGEYYVDTPPWISGAVPHALAAADGDFDSQVESVAAVASYEGLAPGPHVVYVRGQDAAGNWGPFSAGLLVIHAWQNPSNPCDVDGVDGAQAQDALILINSINLLGVRFLPAPAPGSGSPPPFFDVTGDEWITPEDVLRVINYVNTKATLSVLAGESEMVSAPAILLTTVPSTRWPAESATAAVDALMATSDAAAAQRISIGARVTKPGVEPPPDEREDVFGAEGDSWIEWSLEL